MYIVLILNKLHIFIYFNNLYILWDSVFIYIKYSIITNTPVPINTFFLFLNTFINIYIIDVATTTDK